LRTTLASVLDGMKLSRRIGLRDNGHEIWAS
jgi:hypothetical protein